MSCLILQNSYLGLIRDLDEKCAYVVEFVNVNSKEVFLNEEKIAIIDDYLLVKINKVKEIKISDAKGNKLNGVINLYRSN